MGVDFLSRAVEIASQVPPHATRPNPRVGCVIVKLQTNKEQTSKEIIAEGVHEKFGGNHAEVNALAPLCKGDLGGSGLSDCEVYITLEPCDHFEGKKTPSCTELLIQKKPKKIVVGMLDPKFQGKNVAKLRKAGIEVEVRNSKECEEINPFWHKFATTGMPYVTLKLAQSLDGKITIPYPHPLSHGGKRGETSYISNELSRKRVHEMRAEYSAILTTTETVLQDDPRLNCRLGEFSPSPSPREIVQGTLASQEFHGVNSPPTRGGDVRNPDIVVVGKREIPQSAKIFSIPDRKIHFFMTHDLQKVLLECGRMGIDSIMTECGAVMSTELLRKNLVDEIQLFIAPEIFGKGKNAFVGTRLIASLPKNFQRTDVRDSEGDVWVRLKKRKKSL